MRRGGVSGFGGCICVAAVAAGGASADSAPPVWRLYSGVHVSDSSWLIWSGSDTALMSDLHRSGYRIRFAAGSGQDGLGGGSISATKRFFRVMSGYQHVGENSGFGVYAGFARQTRIPSLVTFPLDPKAGTRGGFTAETESWWKSGPWTLSTWASYAVPNQVWCIQLRAMRQINARLAAGAETVYYRDVGAREFRSGAAVAYALTEKITVEGSAGFASDRNSGSFYAAGRFSLER